MFRWQNEKWKSHSIEKGLVREALFFLVVNLRGNVLEKEEKYLPRYI